MPEGELITQIELRYWMDIDGIEFITDKGTKSPHYGGYGGELKHINLVGSLIGFSGKRWISRGTLSLIQFFSREVLNDEKFFGV